MAAEGVAAALLAADEGVRLDHLRPQVLEADRRLVHRHVVQLAQPLHHPRRRQRLDDRPSLAAHLQQVVRQQPEHLELVDVLAVLVHHAHAVGVAVCRQSHVGLLRPHRRRQVGQVAAYRLRRVQSGEDRVALPVQLLRDEASSRQQLPQIADAGAVHGVDAHLEVGCP